MMLHTACVRSNSPEWRVAMANWSLVLLTHYMDILTGKWVFKVKKKTFGSIERHIIRLMANVFHQYEGFDYTNF